MSGRSCLKNEKNSQLNLHKENIRGVLPFAAGATLTRNQRIFLKGRYLISGALLFFYILIISSCTGPSKSYKYKTGDIVYLKPDSIKGVISDVNGADKDYTVVIRHDPGFFSRNIEYVTEEMIY